MADYNASVRSNYFLVKDTALFEKWIADISNDELFVSNDMTDGSVGFLGNCPIPTCDENGEEINFWAGLAAHLVEDEVAVAFEIGSEKLRYLVGRATAVCHTGETTEIDLNDIYRQAQDEFLGCNPIQGAW